MDTLFESVVVSNHDPGVEENTVFRRAARECGRLINASDRVRVSLLLSATNPLASAGFELFVGMVLGIEDRCPRTQVRTSIVLGNTFNATCWLVINSHTGLDTHSLHLTGTVTC